VSRAERAETKESKLPPLLSSRPIPLQVALAGGVPALFGALCGWLLGVSEVAYVVLAVPVAILGGMAAGFEHTEPRQAAVRGLIGGALFGGFILIVHELTGKEPKADLPEPPIVLAVVTAVIGSGLGAIGAGWRRDAEANDGRFLELSKVSPGELLGMASALVLLGSLWLPWFSTSSTNDKSVIEHAGVSGGDTATAWQTFAILDLLLVAAVTAPFILTWIIARGHDLTWRPGEVTMIVGITAFVLILCNGIILGKPDNQIEISLAYGYFVGLLGCTGMLVAGYLRQAIYTDARKPPGVL
jgi:xanthine/uracil permease